MYCVIAEKVLRCEVVEKQEKASWCKIGTAPQSKLVSNHKLFKDEQQAREYLATQKKREVNQKVEVNERVKKCEGLYQEFFQETGIEVRLIDRKWTVNDAKRHIAQLKKALHKKDSSNETSEIQSKKEKFSKNKKVVKKKYSDKKDKKSFGDRRNTEGRTSSSDRKSGETRKSFGDRRNTEGRTSSSDRKSGETRKSFGDRRNTEGRTSSGDRKSGETRKSFGDRKNTNNRGNSSNRKEFGNRKSTGNKTNKK